MYVIGPGRGEYQVLPFQIQNGPPRKKVRAAVGFKFTHATRMPCCHEEKRFYSILK